MENYWAVTMYFFRFLKCIIVGEVVSAFFAPFMSKKAISKWGGFAYIAAMLYLAWVPVTIEQPTILAMLFTVLLLCVLERRNRLQKIVLGITMFLMEWIAHGISLIPRAILFSLVINTQYMLQRAWLQLAVYAFTELLTCIVKGILLYGLVKGVHKVYVDKKADVSGKEFLFLLAVLMTVVVGYLTFSWFSNMYVEETGSYIWNNHEEYSVFETVYQVVSCASLFVMLIAYQKIKNKQQEEKENAILEKQMEDMKSHIAEVERLYDDIRGLKHDMGNHIQVLEQLFLKKETAELEHYFSELKEKWSESTAGMQDAASMRGTVGIRSTAGMRGTAGIRSTAGIKSGNPITDIILTQKQKEASEKGITFVCGFHYPSETRVEVFDISVILNNALENAIRGVDGCDKPMITVRSYRKKNAYMIEIENCIREKVKLDEQTGFPVSTKENQENHGFGLSNIRKIVQKYYGAVDITQSENTFLLSIMLMVK